MGGGLPGRTAQENPTMRTLGILTLIVVVVIGLGFYFEWFKVSTRNQPNHSQIQITVDREKMRQDVNKLKEGAHELKEDARNKTNSNP